MKKKRKIIVLLFSLFLFIPTCFAASSDYVSGTYALYTYDYNIATGQHTNATWSSYKNVTETTTFSTSKSIGRGAMYSFSKLSHFNCSASYIRFINKPRPKMLSILHSIWNLQYRLNVILISNHSCAVVIKIILLFLIWERKSRTSFVIFEDFVSAVKISS